MEVATDFGNATIHLEKAKEGRLLQLSDKDTNEDSDEERNQCWETHGSLGSVLQELKHQGNKKLKNELCKNFIRNGTCYYGFKCQFAHGIDELRKNENQNSKYKTKRCLSYYN